MRSLFLSLAILLTCLTSAEAFAQKGVYRYVDKDGVMVISNVRPGGGGGSKKSAPAKARVPEGDVTMKPAAAPLDYSPRRDTAEYDEVLLEACRTYKIPPALARAIMAVESNFNAQAVSNKGAQGLMQLMPQTASEMFVRDSFDPKQNIHGGVRYLRVLANMFEGDMVKMIAAYNAGPDAVRRAGGAVPEIPETQDYVRKVIRLYYAYKGDT